MAFAELLRFREDLRPAEQARQLFDGFGIYGFGECVEHIAEGGVVFGLNRLADVLFFICGDGQLIGERTEELCAADLQAEVFRARGKRLNGGGDDLDIRFQPRCTQKLDACLRCFVAAAGKILAVAIDRLVIVKPNGLFHRLQTRCGKARDGQC